MRLTTLSVPTSTFGGVALALTISLTKLAVMPMMATIDTTCNARVILKVEARAPVGPAMLKDSIES